MILVVSSSGCFEQKNEDKDTNSDINKTIDIGNLTEIENKTYKFLFVHIISNYININGSLRYYGGDWVPDTWYPWNTNTKTLYIKKNVTIDLYNITAIIYYYYWINHAAYGVLYRGPPPKVIYDHNLPYSQNFYNPMEIIFYQNFTKEIIVNESAFVELRIFNNGVIMANNESLDTDNNFLRFTASWTEFYSDYDPYENKWYNATIDYSGTIEFVYYGNWNVSDIKWT